MFELANAMLAKVNIARIGIAIALTGTDFVNLNRAGL
jgi:hypothetical protein